MHAQAVHNIWNHAGVQTNNAFSTKKFCWLNPVDVNVVLVGFSEILGKLKKLLWERNAATIWIVIKEKH